MYKKIFWITLLIVPFQYLISQVIVSEDFVYEQGTDLIENGWITTYESPTCGVYVDTGLCFDGYPGNKIGGSAHINVNMSSEQPHLSFSTQDSSDLYVAFLFHTTENYKSGYFFSLRDEISNQNFNFTARVFLSDEYNLGLTFADNQKTVYSSKRLSQTQTYLIVLHYQFVPGNNNDSVSLYCYDSLPQSMGTPLIANLADATKKDIHPHNIVLRGYDEDSHLYIDGIRIAKTWHDATGVIQQEPTDDKPNSPDKPQTNPTDTPNDNNNQKDNNEKEDSEEENKQPNQTTIVNTTQQHQQNTTKKRINGAIFVIERNNKKFYINGTNIK